MRVWWEIEDQSVVRSQCSQNGKGWDKSGMKSCTPRLIAIGNLGRMTLNSSIKGKESPPPQKKGFYQQEINSYSSTLRILSEIRTLQENLIPKDFLTFQTNSYSPLWVWVGCGIQRHFGKWWSPKTGSLGGWTLPSLQNRALLLSPEILGSLEIKWMGSLWHFSCWLFRG